jgi:phospholipase/carboxylesterase
MAPLLDGPRLSAKSGAPKQLVVLLHGYGADGNDLIEIGKQWQSLLPDAAFISPHAPNPCAQAPNGREWFQLSLRDQEELWQGVCQARPALDAFLDTELARLNLDDSRLALVGFSQGTMMALHVGLRRRQAPAAILGYSGVLVGAEHLGEATARGVDGRPPPVFLIHGSEDDLISAESLFVAGEDLSKFDIPCQWHMSLGVGHGIDAGGLLHGGLFVANSFGVAVSFDRPRRGAG